MSETAFGSSPGRAFIESAAHARDDTFELQTAWAVLSKAIATHYQWGWNNFDGHKLNPHSDAQDKWLKQRRLVTILTEGDIGATWDQTFTMDRVTGVVTASAPIYTPTPGPEGFPFVSANELRVEVVLANYLKATGYQNDISQPLFTLEIFQASPNTFELAAIRCAALLDKVNLDDYPIGTTINIGYQTDSREPDAGRVVTDVVTRDLGPFPYSSYHELGPTGVNPPVAGYEYNVNTSAVPGFDVAGDSWPQNYFYAQALAFFLHMEPTADPMTMWKSKTQMHGELCVTSRRTEFSLDEPGGRTTTDVIIKCVPYVLAEPEGSDGTRVATFLPPCRRGFYWWHLDAWPKNFTIFEGEEVTIPDYPTACDLLDRSGADPNCGTNP